MKDEILPDRRGTREDDFLRDIPGTVPYGFRGRDKSIDGDNPSHINSRFGGAKPYDVSNIFFTNFKDDPWVEAGVANARAASDHTCFADCDGCGHYRDLHEPSADDPKELQQCRDRFADVLAGWLPPLPSAA